MYCFCFSILAAFYISAVWQHFVYQCTWNASEEPVVGKYYKSIQIQKGDTLQSLADTYAKDSDKKTIARYIKEVKKLNGMWLNDLCAGDYLLIIYYDSVPEVM